MKEVSHESFAQDFIRFIETKVFLHLLTDVFVMSIIAGWGTTPVAKPCTGSMTNAIVLFTTGRLRIGDRKAIFLQDGVKPQVLIHVAILYLQ